MDIMDKPNHSRKLDRKKKKTNAKVYNTDPQLVGE